MMLWTRHSRALFAGRILILITTAAAVSSLANVRSEALAVGDSAPFSLQQVPTSVSVTAPNGGTFTAGQSLLVTWNTQGPAGAHAVLLSQDNGQSYTNVSGNDLPGSARSFQFLLPTPLANQVQARVRVAAKDAPNGTRLAVGDSAPFSLQQVPPQVQFELGASSVSEDGGSTTVRVMRTGDLSGRSTVEYVISDGTAKAGVDYRASAPSGTLTFNPGEMVKTITIAILDNALIECDKTFNIMLRNPVGAALATQNGAMALTIAEDDVLRE